MPLASGTLLNNRYRIVSILGQGGMGAVYRASDEHLLIPVALKENLFLTEEYGRQFQREAHILAGLRHPNLPHVSDYFSMENQGQYLVMDYVEGEDLRQRMERMGALPEREVVLIGISICDALTYLHTRRAAIVHRDIKPGNIKVTPDGQAVLVDFGLAKIMNQATSTGARAMTPGYSPPEQYGTARTDVRSDIYSLGATLYAALTGVIPEDGLARMTGKAKLTPIRELAPKVNRRLAEAVEQALEVDPDDRFQSAEDLKRSLIEAGELANYYQERPTISPPPAANSGEPAGNEESASPSNRSKSKGRGRRAARRRLGWTLAPVVLLIAAGLYFLITMRPDLVSGVAGYFTILPTQTITTTQVSSANLAPSSEPGTSPGPASTTDSATRPVQPTENSAAQTAATVEGTPAAAPEASKTPEFTPTATATPMGGGQGQIAFVSNRFNGMQIWLLDVNSPQTPHQVTNQPDGACQPSWSPDGLQMAFISPCREKTDRYPGANIYIISLDAAGNPDQNSVKQITRGFEGDYDPAWSPDGKRIAYTSLKDGRSSIYVLRLDDSAPPEQLTQLVYQDKQPAWAPSGLQIVFVRQQTSSQVWFMADNGQSQTRLSVLGPNNNTWPVWSRDGQGVFYSQTSPDSTVPTLIYRRYEDRNNAKETRIPSKPRTDMGPIVQVSPSPDGFWLAYESWLSGDSHDIYIMNVNGSGVKKITTDPGLDFNPVWRPLPTPMQP